MAERDVSSSAVFGLVHSLCNHLWPRIVGVHYIQTIEGGLAVPAAPKNMQGPWEGRSVRAGRDAGECHAERGGHFKNNNSLSQQNISPQTAPKHS